MSSKPSIINSELLFKKLIENTTDAVFVIDDHGHHIDVNTRWCDFLGRSKNEILEMSIWDFIHTDEKDNCKPP